MFASSSHLQGHPCFQLPLCPQARCLRFVPAEGTKNVPFFITLMQLLSMSEQLEIDLTNIDQ